MYGASEWIFLDLWRFFLLLCRFAYLLQYDDVTQSGNLRPDFSWTADRQPFSTYDEDNSAKGDCASKTYHKGWWYHKCISMHLNGEYPRGFDRSPKRWHRYIVALAFRRDESLSACSMKVRPMAVGDDVRAYCERHRKNPCRNGGTCVYVAATNR